MDKIRQIQNACQSSMPAVIVIDGDDDEKIHPVRNKSEHCKFNDKQKNCETNNISKPTKSSFYDKGCSSSQTLSTTIGIENNHNGNIPVSGNICIDPFGLECPPLVSIIMKPQDQMIMNAKNKELDNTKSHPIYDMMNSKKISILKSKLTPKDSSGFNKESQLFKVKEKEEATIRHNVFCKNMVATSKKTLEESHKHFTQVLSQRKKQMLTSNPNMTNIKEFRTVNYVKRNIGETTDHNQSSSKMIVLTDTKKKNHYKSQNSYGYSAKKINLSSSLQNHVKFVKIKNKNKTFMIKQEDLIKLDSLENLEGCTIDFLEPISRSGIVTSENKMNVIAHTPIQNPETKQLLVEQRVFLRDPEKVEDINDIVNVTHKITDPLHIPAVQSNGSVVEVKSSTNLSETNIARNETSLTKQKKESCVPSRTSKVTETKKKPGNVQRINDEKNVILLKSPNEKINKNSTKKNIGKNCTKLSKSTVTSSPQEHKIVATYALQNCTKNREMNKNCEHENSSDNNSNCCRNLFIKNSAWDSLEITFKGFNEREIKISSSCFHNIGQNLDSFSRNQCHQEHNYVNQFYYTRKIELLDPEGNLDKVIIPTKKRKIKKAPCILPPTKKCKIVIERDEAVEQKLKFYLLNKELNSYILKELILSLYAVKKPLIIINKENFSVIKFTEQLCKYSSILYVKEVDENFPEKLLQDKVLIDQIRQKGIQVITPEALKRFFM